MKYLVTLGLMKLGAPAVVPSSFPFPYGNRVVADEIEDMVAKGTSFANLRVKYFNKEKISLPAFCNTAFSNQKIDNPEILGGTPNSFFSVMAGQNIKKSITVTGEPVDEIGIEVKIEHEKLSDDLIFMIQQTALKSISFLDGVNAFEKDGMLFVQTERGSHLDSSRTGEAIYWGIRLKYPRLTNIAIDIIYDKELLKQKARKAKEYKEHCKAVVDNMSEDNTEEFCVCTDCRRFSTRSEGSNREGCLQPGRA